MVNNHCEVENVVGYARISSDSQIENTSIEEQKKRIEAQCIAKGWNLLKTFVDQGYSGSNTDRPAYQEMIKYLDDNQDNVQGIMVNKMDRAHRNQLNLLNFIKVELEQMKIDFISISESFDTSTSMGRMVLGVLSTFSEFERETINERTKSGRIATANKNRYAGGQVPYGYEVLEGQVVVTEEQAEIVKMVFDEYANSKKSFNKVAETLNDRGITTKSGKKWTSQHIKNMITLETYTGKNSYNGETEKNGIVQKDVYPKIISKQLFNRSQIKVQETKREKK